MSRHQYRRGKTPFRRGGSDSTPSPRARREYCALRVVYGQCRAAAGIWAMPFAHAHWASMHAGASRGEFSGSDSPCGTLSIGISPCGALPGDKPPCGTLSGDNPPCGALSGDNPPYSVPQMANYCPRTANVSEYRPAKSRMGNPARKRQVRSEYPQSIFGAHALPY